MALRHRNLFRLGLTGKLLFHVGWILAVSFGLVVTLTYLRARTAIRDELRKIQVHRVQAWAAAHDPAIREGDRWKLAEAVEELSRAPYVVYAGVFDGMGNPIAQTGDEDAYLKRRTLDLLIALKPGGLRRPSPGEPAVPGLVAEAPAFGKPLPIPERLRHVLSGDGSRGKTFAWVAVTLTTDPLDALADGVILPVAVLAVALLLAALTLTWLVSRRVAEPLAQLAATAEQMAAGDLDGTFTSIPRPQDEVGDLATRLSVLSVKLKRSRSTLEEQNRKLREELDEEKDRLSRLAHDLRNRASSILAFGEILADEGPEDPGERKRFLDLMRGESEALAERLGEEMEPVPPAPPEEGGAPSRAVRKVLIVSADERLRSVLAERLGSEEIEILQGASGASAHDLARGHRPDAIVMDMLLPAGAAFDAIGDLRRDAATASIRVVPLGVVRDRDAFLTAGVRFLPKPVRREELLGAASGAMRRERAGARILVVDDDRYVAAGLRAILEEAGQSVETASGGEEALHAAEKNPPDLLIVDLAMPGMDGVELCRRIRSMPQTLETPVIITTGMDVPGGPGPAWPGASVGADEFAGGVKVALTKPGDS